MRRRGKAAFEALIDAATPLSDFLLAELAQRSPPTSAEGRAALVNAAKPLLAQLNAPVLAALLRRRLAEIAGLPEAELAGLLPARARVRCRVPGPQRRRPRREGRRRCCATSSSACCSSRTWPARSRCRGRSTRAPEGAALAALVDFCHDSAGPLTTAGVVQHFAGGAHDAVLLAALTAGASEGFKRGIAGNRARGRCQTLLDGAPEARPRVRCGGPSGPIDLSPEEAERARQRRLVQDGWRAG